MALAKCMTCIPDADSALIYGLCQQANGTISTEDYLTTDEGDYILTEDGDKIVLDI